MDNMHNNELGLPIHLTKKLPLLWHLCEKQSLDQEVEDWQSLNEQTLLNLTLFDDSSSNIQMPIDNDNTGLEILNKKINLLSQLLQYYLQQQVRLPDKKQVCLSANGIEWQQQQALNFVAGDYIKIELILNVIYPRPLEIACCVQDLQQSNAHYKIVCDFYRLGENVAELLEKMLFRHHRREIAKRNSTNK